MSEFVRPPQSSTLEWINTWITSHLIKVSGTYTLKSNHESIDAMLVPTEKFVLHKSREGVYICATMEENIKNPAEKRLNFSPEMLQIEPLNGSNIIVLHFYRTKTMTKSSCSRPSLLRAEEGKNIAINGLTKTVTVITLAGQHKVMSSVCLQTDK